MFVGLLLAGIMDFSVFFLNTDIGEEFSDSLECDNDTVTSGCRLCPVVGEETGKLDLQEAAVTGEGHGLQEAAVMGDGVDLWC